MTVSDSSGELIHGAFFAALASRDAGLAREVHDGPVKPFTLSVLQAPEGRPAERILAGGEYWFRFTAMGPRAASLCLAWEGGQALRIGRIRFAIGEVRHPAEEAEVRASGAFEIEFLSPAAFKCGDSHLPLPEPGLLWDGLDRKWALASGSPGEMISADAWRRVVRLREHELRTVAFRLRDCIIPGFVGRAVFETDKRAPADLRSRAARLAAFARIAGVGVKTTVGMGQVRTQSLA